MDLLPHLPEQACRLSNVVQQQLADRSFDGGLCAHPVDVGGEAADLNTGPQAATASALAATTGARIR